MVGLEPLERYRSRAEKLNHRDPLFGTYPSVRVDGPREKNQSPIRDYSNDFPPLPFPLPFPPPPPLPSAFLISLVDDRAAHGSS